MSLRRLHKIYKMEDYSSSQSRDNEVVKDLDLLKSFLSKSFEVDPSQLPKSSKCLKDIKQERINKKLDKFLTLDEPINYPEYIIQRIPCSTPSNKPKVAVP
eukprot:TRINITY_DN15585_c0_g1_i3.p1 TRINITY_DN15585_c0_g1~~TRINITY_DN15585_c0_g1_i3.p1  ORF type:complete len:101 (-),score=11.13 TRINITY_DN15585_c0_g1_i3:212-514(-)